MLIQTLFACVRRNLLARNSLAIVLAFAAVVSGHSTSAVCLAANDEVPTLRYGWKQGEEHAFQVTISIDMDDKEETHTGTPSYKVIESGDDGIKLQFVGSVHASTKMKQRLGGFPGFPGPPPFPRHGFGPPGHTGPQTLTINERGRIITAEGNSQLPYLLGDLAQLILVPLPKSNEKSWNVNRETSIAVSQNSSQIRHPFFDRQDKKIVRAEEESIYAIAKTEGDVVTIKESYSLQALELVKKKPSMEMIGDATLLFDTKVGGPISYTSNISLVLREGNSTTEIPISIKITRVDPAELEAQRQAAMEAAAKAKELADVEMRKPLEPSELAALVDDLNSDDKDRARKALDKLARKVPPADDATVSAAIDRYVTHDDFWLRKSALSALEKWGTKESLPAMLTALEDKDVFHRGIAVALVGKYPSQECADALAPLLEDNFSRGKAAEALMGMPEFAEKPTLPHLESKDFVTQMETCKVLGAIGGEASVKALTKLANDGNGLVKINATKALEEIRKRGGK